MNNNIIIPEQNSHDLVNDLFSQATWGDLEGLTWEDMQDLSWSEVTIPAVIRIFGRKFSSNIASQRESLLHLKDSYKNNNLVLVLGAGVSRQCKLPDWNDLIKNLRQIIHISSEDLGDNPMIKAKLFIKFFDTNPLITARYIRQHCCSDKSNNILFEKLVRQSLYNKKKIKFTKMFDGIGYLCKGNKDSAINSIITYNYDDLLERFLGKPEVKIPFKSIYYPIVKNPKIHTHISVL